MARAPAIPPEERRAAIMAVTEELIVAQGSDVSTRAIAEAAGIAEGTIFRVFPTKAAIVDAIFEDAFDRGAAKAALSAVDMRGDLEARMIETAGILQRRIRRILALFSAVGFRRPPSLRGLQGARPHELNLAEVAAILEPDRARLRVPPLEAARLLHAMVVALTLPMTSGRNDTNPAEIVSLVLNGIALHPASSP